MEEQDRLGREVSALTEELDREREIASSQIAVKERQLEVKDQQIAEMQAELERLREEMQQIQTAAADQRQNQSASSPEAWWQSPYVLSGAVGVVVLLLVYALIVARRRRAEDEDFYADVADEDTVALDRRAPAVTAAAGAPVFTDEAPDDDDPAITAGRGRTARAEAEATGSETGDVIGEADIYIAYGRYPQAIGLLLGVLEEDPRRNDVRLKLLELYAETRDREAFDTHMAELVNRCDDDEALLTARELGAQFGDGAAGGAVSADSGDPDDAFGRGSVAAVTGPGPGGPAAEAGSPLGAEDFELELDDLSGEEAAGAPGSRSHAENALGGDLGLDFDPQREQNGASHADAGGEGADTHDLTDTDLDLDLDLDETAILGDDAFDFGDEGDTAGTKLDLARAYIDMGDQDGARDILNEVVAEGSTEQQKRAQAMLEEL
jgi:pilus assembly protein FimV